MLYQIGPLTLDTRPFNVDDFSRKTGGDHAAKDVMGTLRPREFMGEGDETLTMSGQILPMKIGGLTELEMARSLCKGGTHVPVMRGDGLALGWFVIDSVAERHKHLMRDGVGFAVQYDLQLTRVPHDGPSASGNGSGGIMGMLMDLFEAL